MAALSAHVMLYSGVFPTSIEYSLKLDTWAVGFLIEALGRPVEIQGTSIFVGEGINIRLISFCGSIWPALTGLAAITTLASCVNGIGLRRGLTAAAAGLLMIIGLNWLRLAFMTTGQGSYDWFHAGSGTTLFRLSVIMIVVTTVLWAGMARDHHSVEEIRK
jgi:exosortase/archaeosortase family protein